MTRGATHSCQLGAEPAFRLVPLLNVRDAHRVELELRAHRAEHDVARAAGGTQRDGSLRNRGRTWGGCVGLSEEDRGSRVVQERTSVMLSTKGTTYRVTV